MSRPLTTLGSSKATLGYWLLKLDIIVHRVALAPGDTMEVKRGRASDEETMQGVRQDLQMDKELIGEMKGVGRIFRLPSWYGLRGHLS